MTSDSKDSHEGHVALEGCRHENLELVYHIQGFDPEYTAEPLERQSKEIVSSISLGFVHPACFGIWSELFSTSELR